MKGSGEFVSDDEWFNLTLEYLKDLKNVLKLTIFLRSQVVIAPNLKEKQKRYIEFKESLISLIQMCLVMRRFPRDEFEEHLEKVQEIEDQYDEENFDELKRILLDVLLDMRQQDPFEKIGRVIPLGEAIAETMK